jgi:glycine cleavage system transcriptional repressor
VKTRFKNAYVLNVMADDHPGIVAAVTGAVNRFGGNIDAASQTVLEGYFTLIMIVSLPQATAPQEMADAVRGEGAQTGFDVGVRAFDPGRSEPPRTETERFVLTAFGRDINIIDLYGERKGEDFVLVSQVEIPKRLELGMLQADLEHLAGEEGFTVRLQHENVFVATNQLRLVPPPQG